MDSNELNNELKTTVIHEEDKFHVVHSYDAEPVIEQNKSERDAFTTYKAAGLKNGMVKVASLHQGDVERLSSLGYDLLSPDPEEWRRALLYIQSEQKALMTVTGKPLGKKTSWR